MDRLEEELAAFAHILRLIAARLLGRPIIQVPRGVRITISKADG